MTSSPQSRPEAPLSASGTEHRHSRPICRHDEFHFTRCDGRHLRNLMVDRPNPANIPLAGISPQDVIANVYLENCVKLPMVLSVTVVLVLGGILAYLSRDDPSRSAADAAAADAANAAAHVQSIAAGLDSVW